MTSHPTPTCSFSSFVKSGTQAGEALLSLLVSGSPDILKHSKGIPKCLCSCELHRTAFNIAEIKTTLSRVRASNACRQSTRCNGSGDTVRSDLGLKRGHGSLSHPAMEGACTKPHPVVDTGPFPAVRNLASQRQTFMLCCAKVSYAQAP